ncbi:MAG: cytochrome ubiquinol oxidase subunit I [Bacteroidales bacterium]|nr:cytochrome ubiquinol oxidase subunit I [Bacteroidales bacterium]
MEGLDLALVNWSRAQFALTAMYHWIFVPLTLGLAFIIAFMETIYVRTGNEQWKNITKFWMNLFGVNFAIGVATGIILEFEFGTNWSNYSWIVGDIFGAPLAIEGIMAFFMESTFIAIMFFGWDKVSKKFHLLSTWLTAFGANLSALWILIANGWMQFPIGMKFNPDTARHEMESFWDILFSPVGINKFLHTVSSGYVLASIFVVGISAWFLLKKRHEIIARKSIVVAAVFGLISSGYLALTGDESAKVVAKYQPMKFAAMEGFYDGQEGAPLVAIGFFGKKDENSHREQFAFKLEIPNLLSFLAFSDLNAFVPGIQDLVHGNEERGLIPYSERIKNGKIAIDALAAYKNAKKAGNETKAIEAEKIFRANFKDFGYGYYYQRDVHELVPHVPTTFYAFHTMVILASWFLLLFALVLFFEYKNQLATKKWMLYAMLWTIPLGYIAQQAGWVVAEVGRQPWVIQDLLPTIAAVSNIDVVNVQTTFWMFFVTFTVLLIAEFRIMFKQIGKGPKEI